MRSYGRKNSNLLAFFIVLLLLFILANLFSRTIRGFFYYITGPIQEKLWWTGGNISDFFEGIGRAGSLKDRVDDLEEINKQLIAKLTILREIEEENTSLKESLGLELNKKYGLILGKIISKNTAEDIIIINKGSSSGIEEGMPVINQGEILVGRIKEVYSSYSKVLLSSDKNTSFDVRIKHENKDVSAIAEGKGNLRIFLNLIPQEEEISEGDMIVTDSLGGIFPGSLVVGRVKGIRRSDVSPFQEAEVESFFNLVETKSIFVISDSNI